FFNKGVFLEAKVISGNQLRHNILGIIKGKFVNNFKKGSKVKLLIQPEDITHDNTSKLKLIICDRKFRGTNFIYYLKLNANEAIPVSVQSHNCEPCNINDELGIKLPIFINHLVFF
ncbi:MAG: iron ABC transporter, partial [Rickettsiales bacterium]|nr:iron ABC transporter [Rickettsiales bacterium]